MDKVIKLRSRGRNYLQLMSAADGSESKTYMLKADSPIIRTGYIDDNKFFIDPSGGPMLIAGEYLPEAEAVIKSIDHISGLGYAITFE